MYNTDFFCLCVSQSLHPLMRKAAVAPTPVSTVDSRDEAGDEASWPQPSPPVCTRLLSGQTCLVKEDGTVTPPPNTPKIAFCSPTRKKGIMSYTEYQFYFHLMSQVLSDRAGEHHCA